jgi:hypothetical protein
MVEIGPVFQCFRKKKTRVYTLFKRFLPLLFTAPSLRVVHSFVHTA